MTDYENQPNQPAEEPSYDRAAAHIAKALSEIERAAAARAVAGNEALAGATERILDITQRMQQDLEEEKSQRAVLADQLTNLASSLDRLGAHLQGLSQLLADLLERLAEPTPLTPTLTPPPPAEPTFPAGGEGVSLSLAGVPGFQALMDLQKALIALEQVEGASVERFQEGDSRILLQLRGPVTAEALAEDLRSATGHNIVVEESRPELLRLRLKIVNGAPPTI